MLTDPLQPFVLVGAIAAAAVLVAVVGNRPSTAYMDALLQMGAAFLFFLPICSHGMVSFLLEPIPKIDW